MEVAYKEGLKRDEELKKIKDSLVRTFSDFVFNHPILFFRF